jgi:hypothetical protein
LPDTGFEHHLPCRLENPLGSDTIPELAIELAVIALPSSNEAGHHVLSFHFAQHTIIASHNRSSTTAVGEFKRLGGCGATAAAQPP